jgi:hypothetical protein
MTSNLVGELFAFILTIMVFSYIIGDNPFYRAAVHAFLGVAAGYMTVITLQGVIYPRLFSVYAAATSGDVVGALLLAVPFILSIFILLRVSGSLAPIGNIVIALMVGVGAALAIGGAIMGTIIPQVQASWSDAANPDVADRLLVWVPSVLGTTLVLLYFLYVGRNNAAGHGERPRILLPVNIAGESFLTVALAALYVGTLAATFTLLVERVGFMYLFVTDRLQPFITGSIF